MVLTSMCLCFMMIRLVDRQPAQAEQSAPRAAPYQGLRTTQVPDRRANLGADMDSMEVGLD